MSSFSPARRVRFSIKRRLAPSMMLPILVLLCQLPASTFAQNVSQVPSNEFSMQPSFRLSLSPQPSMQPSFRPSLSPQPSMQPSFRPSLSPQPSMQPSSEPSRPEEYKTAQTWALIRVTFLINLMIMILLLTLYEVGRRTPVLKDIYDRKRETRPGRTPPKMLSSAGKGHCSWLRYVGRLLECLFVDGYIDKDYASFAARQSAETSAKKSRPSSSESGETKDEQGLAFYRGESESARNVPPLESEIDTVGADPSKALTKGEEAAWATFSNGEDAEARSNSELASVLDGSGKDSGKDSGLYGLNEGLIDIEEAPCVPCSDDEEAAETRFYDISGLESAKDENSKKRSAVETSKCESGESAKTLPAQESEGGAASIKSEESAKPEVKEDSGVKPLIETSATPRGTETDTANTAKSDPPTPSRWSFFWIRAGSTLFKRPDPATVARRSAVPFHFRWMLHLPLLKPAPIPPSDRELLRCIGLDTYVMIRFLRLGFEVTFYPFLFFCITLIPLYYTSDYEGEYAVDEDGVFATTVVNGYFSITINHLEEGSNKLWAVWAFSILYYQFLLRRLWVEWVVFVEFRKDFLCRGDQDAVKEDDGESLKQYQNSCLVEYIPSSHRRDKDIYLFYNTLFPGQVRRAEAVLASEELTKLIKKRQRLLELYESAQARYTHSKMVYERRLDSFEKGEKSLCGCSKREPTEPAEPKVRVGDKRCCFGGEEVLALPHYLSEIVELNALVEDEYQSIVQRKEESDRESVMGEQRHVSLQPGTPKPRDLQRWTDLEMYLYKVFVPPVAEAPPLGNCGNAFVEFRTRSTKQAALQCNLTGQAGYFDTFAAPDPRDLVWENAMIERTTTKRLKFYVECLLIVGILFWAGFVAAVGSIKSAIEESNYDPNQNLLGFIGGYLPPLLLIIIMALLPIGFHVLGFNVVRFKAKSEVDKFALKWNFCYRLANFLAVLIGGTLYTTLLQFQKDPEEVVRKLANAVLSQSQFFMNLVLIDIGTGLMLQLSQLWSVLYWILVRSICTLEGISERGLQRMREPKWFIFGRFTPGFVYILMTGIVYSTMVPLIIGGCSLYFFIASKVYTHQALFVFSQRYEGGGKLMYTITTMVFIVIYVSIIIFGVILSLKKVPVASGTFLVFMLALTIFYDYKLKRELIRPSKALPLTRARILDEEYTSLLGERKTGSSSEEAGAPSVSLSTELGVTRMSALPNKFIGDRRKLLCHGRGDSESFRGLDDSGVGMGIGQPRLFGRKGSTDSNLDYYLYRQPDLNKAKWETEPRPYRSASVDE